MLKQTHGKGSFICCFLLWRRSAAHFSSSFCACRGRTAALPRPLSAEEEAKLLKKMREEGDTSARNLLIEHNLRLVSHIIKKYYSPEAERDDLVSIGTIGLIKAVDTFQAERGIRLTTYASKCIQNELLMHFRRKRRTAGEVSLSDTLETDGDGNALSLQDTISCEDEGLNAVDDHDRYYSMYRALFSSLSPREREVIRLRYGLGAAAPLPQHEIARRMNLSRSYISRIEKRALEKLRGAIGEMPP